MVIMGEIGILILISSLLISCPGAASTSSLSVVKHLPGFDGDLPFYLETGYVEVNEEKDAHIFYYFVKSERRPEEDPVIVWLTGGPGCSGLSAILFELGPLRVDVPGYDEGLPSLFYNPYTWTKVCNIIFLDSPVATGFSYSNQTQGYETGDTKSALDVYIFIKKWFMDHEEFLHNPLYIGGDSYSGITVPLVAQAVVDSNEAGYEMLFNFKGYLAGNPLTDLHFDNEYKIPYAHGMGLLADELYESAQRKCGREFTNPSTANCENSLQLIYECLSGINPNHILEPLCFFASPKPHGIFKYRRQMLEEQIGELPISKANLPLECRSSGYLLSSIWANNDTVREALHIRQGTVPNWKRCNYGIPYRANTQSVVKVHQNLTTRGYRALVYSGDHDMVVPHLGTQAWIRSLNFSILDDWRSWSVDGQIGGYTRSYSNNLTFATVKGGGHTVPEYNPKECQAMIDRWLSEVPL